MTDRITITLDPELKPTPAFVEYADIGIIMTYSPSLCFGLWKHTKMFRFVLIRDAERNLIWQDQPADNEFKTAWQHIVKRYIRITGKGP